jgi:hypothetical protein
MIAELFQPDKAYVSIQKILRISSKKILRTKEALDKGEPIPIHQPADHLTKIVPVVVKLVQTAVMENSLLG